MESLKKLLNENVTFLCNENFDQLDLPEKISLDFQETEKFEETKETNLSICIKLSISWFFTRATKTKAFTITPCKLKVKHFQIRQNVGSSGQELFCENGVLKDFAIFTGNTVAGCYVIKKRLQQFFSCEYCEIFKNIYFEKHLQAAACKNVSKTYSMFSKLNPKDVFLSLLLTSLVWIRFLAVFII